MPKAEKKEKKEKKSKEVVETVTESIEVGADVDMEDVTVAKVSGLGRLVKICKGRQEILGSEEDKERKRGNNHPSGRFVTNSPASCAEEITEEAS
jgi:hypothetical protein